MRVLFAHPDDVAFADQAAAASTGVVVRLRRLVPVGRMYLVADRQAGEISTEIELNQLAERVIRVEHPSSLGDSSRP